MAVNPIHDYLEPAAKDIIPEVSFCSIAVSLKRIADSLYSIQHQLENLQRLNSLTDIASVYRYVSGVK